MWTIVDALFAIASIITSSFVGMFENLGNTRGPEDDALDLKLVSGYVLLRSGGDSFKSAQFPVREDGREYFHNVLRSSIVVPKPAGSRA